MFLLDTNIVIWSVLYPALMPKHIRSFLDQQNEPIYLSIVNLIEISIKQQKGKLPEHPKIDDIEGVFERNHIKTLGLSTRTIMKTYDMPFHHKDPFDRLIIAQAVEHKLTVVTTDGEFQHYGIACFGNES